MREWSRNEEFSVPSNRRFLIWQKYAAFFFLSHMNNSYPGSPWHLDWRSPPRFVYTVVSIHSGKEITSLVVADKRLSAVVSEWLWDPEAHSYSQAQNKLHPFLKQTIYFLWRSMQEPNRRSQLASSCHYVDGLKRWPQLRQEPSGAHWYDYFVPGSVGRVVGDVPRARRVYYCSVLHVFSMGFL